MRQLSMVFFCALCYLGSFSQDSEFKIEVSSDTLLAGNYFELKFSMENIDGKFEAPDLSSFDVIGGPNSSSSFSMVNGLVTQSSSYSFYLKPRDIGVYTIPPAYLVTESDTLATIPIDIIVVPNPDGKIQEPHRPTQRFEDLLPDMKKYNQKPSKKEKPTVKSKRKKRIF